MRRSALSSLALVAILATAGPSRAGLIAHYTFDETGGTIAHDSVGGIDGTLNGGASFAPGAGRFGGAVLLDRTASGLVNMGNNFSFNGSSDFSIAVWFNTSDTASAGSIVIGKHFTTHSVGYFLGLGNTGDGLGGTAHVALTHGPDGTVAYSGGQTNKVVVDGQWHQAVEVDHAGSQFMFYIDGVLQDTRPSDTINTTPKDFLVGGVVLFNGTPTGFYNGLIDDLRIYNNALSGSDVTSLFNPNPTTATPEPSTLALAVLGGTAMIGFAVRKRRGDVG